LVQDTNSRSDADQERYIAEEMAALKNELAAQKAQAEANLAGWQRAQADFANFKRRSEQEKEDLIKFANSMLVLRILPVLDDFERAVTSLPEDMRASSWVEGVKLIEKKLRNTLESQGLSPIQATGELFDPRFHEAIRQDKGKEGIIVAEMERGYKFQDRVIRPSKVVVGMGEEEIPPIVSTVENRTGEADQ
jgi:molecular chaperone GrpE